MDECCWIKRLCFDPENGGWHLRIPSTATGAMTLMENGLSPKGLRPQHSVRVAASKSALSIAEVHERVQCYSTAVYGPVEYFISMSNKGVREADQRQEEESMP